MGILICIIVSVCYFDFRYFQIPNLLNGALFAAGLASVFYSVHLNVLVQVFSAGILLMLFYGVRQLHSKLRGQVGLGLGDVKMAGAGAVWLYPPNLPYFIMIASFTALVFALAGRKKVSRSDNSKFVIPFGPFIGLSLVLVWIGQTLNLYSLGGIQ